MQQSSLDNSVLLCAGVPNICSLDGGRNRNRHRQNRRGCLPSRRRRHAAELPSDGSRPGVRAGAVPRRGCLHSLPCRDQGPRDGLTRGVESRNLGIQMGILLHVFITIHQ